MKKKIKKQKPLRVIRFFGTHKDVFGYAVFRKKDVPGTKRGDLIKWGQANAILYGLTKKSAIEHRKRLEKEARERIKRRKKK